MKEKLSRARITHHGDRYSGDPQSRNQRCWPQLIVNSVQPQCSESYRARSGENTHAEPQTHLLLMHS